MVSGYAHVFILLSVVIVTLPRVCVTYTGCWLWHGCSKAAELQRQCEQTAAQDSTLAQPPPTSLRGWSNSQDRRLTTPNSRPTWCPTEPLVHRAVHHLPFSLRSRHCAGQHTKRTIRLSVGVKYSTCDVILRDVNYYPGSCTCCPTKFMAFPSRIQRRFQRHWSKIDQRILRRK